jgi:hypothetical protein
MGGHSALPPAHYAEAIGMSPEPALASVSQSAVLWDLTKDTEAHTSSHNSPLGDPPKTRCNAPRPSPPTRKGVSEILCSGIT